MLVLAPMGAALAEDRNLRIASYHTDLARDGPGLLLRDIISGDDPQVEAVLDVIVAADADVIVLQDFDLDAGGASVATLAQALSERGASYPYRYAEMGNAGRPTGFDLDGDGRSYRARDAHAFGYFSGEGGMVLLSRLPFGLPRDFTDFVWRDLPESSVAQVTPAAATEVLRLHSIAAWHIPLQTPAGVLHLLTSHATAPVFDGPEDRNGLRNADEIRFWQLYLDGWSPDGAPLGPGPVVFAGTLNVDPNRGEGRQDDLRALLEHPRLRDASPASVSGRTETVDWPDPDPGDLRVDYILTDQSQSISAHGMIAPQDAQSYNLDPEGVRAASAHWLIWVDVAQ